MWESFRKAATHFNTDFGAVKNNAFLINGADFWTTCLIFLCFIIVQLARAVGVAVGNYSLSTPLIE